MKEGKKDAHFVEFSWKPIALDAHVARQNLELGQDEVNQV